MSLLVHEFVLGTGTSRSASSGLQSSSNSVASVPLLNSVQVAQLPQSRVVTIVTSAPSRTSTSVEKGSRLAEALTGNPSCSLTNSYNQFSRTLQNSYQPINYIASTTEPTVLQSYPSKVSSRQSYILPFVLQDHNYGAPPPSTPPQSPPPPLPAVSNSPCSYKVHRVVSPTKTTNSNQRTVMLSQYGSSASPTQTRRAMTEHSILSLNNVTTVQFASANSGSPPSGNSGSTNITSHIMASMPLHRQQFMPHPKVPLFSPPLPPSNRSENLSTGGIISPNRGADTDEESRLSDHSSSAGPSGEETETAPEGEGEEVQADDSVTRCICNFTHDDGYMIQCDRCFVWQHVDCMDIDRNNIPDEYLCEACMPRQTNRGKARALQVKRRQEFKAQLSRVSSSDSDNSNSPKMVRSLGSVAKTQERKVLKKKKPKPVKENKSTRIKQPSPVKSNLLVHPKDREDREAKVITKSKRRCSSGAGGDDSNNLDQLRLWIEDYEIAVTNHYSQELRAKVHSARINGISQEFRESTQGAMLGHRCRVAPSYDVTAEEFEHKVLVAATRLAAGTAIIEYQGKYTLQSQWDSVQIPPKLPYLPFVLQYSMQKEGIHVCVDARTYGNDARFARRSNQYNAEICHVVERGSIHLYIVASRDIEEEEEIILPLDTAICSPNVNSKSILPKGISSPGSDLGKKDLSDIVPAESPAPAPKVEPVKSPTPTLVTHKSESVQTKKTTVKKPPVLTITLPEALSRTRRRSTSGSAPTHEKVSSPLSNSSQLKTRRASASGNSRPSVKSPSKASSKSSFSKTTTENSANEEYSEPASKDSSGLQKMSREERKIAAYMKAFERMEKAALRRQEMAKRKGSEGKHSESQEDEDDATKSGDEYIRADKAKKRGKRSNKGTPSKSKNDSYDDIGSDNNGSSSEGEKMNTGDGSLIGSPPANGSQNPFRFPKTKKALMNEWLNETVDPVMHPTVGELASGVPTCYMRSPSTPLRKGSTVIGNLALSNMCPTVNVLEMAGCSAKKRWLRQAIIDGTEPHGGGGFAFCSSPNSRPDSPTSAGDYITPLKKRRLARESMSSEQSNTPPSTPAHSSMEEEKFNEEMEIETLLHRSLDVKSEDKIGLKSEMKSEENGAIVKVKEESKNGENTSDSHLAVAALTNSVRLDTLNELKIPDNSVKKESDDIPKSRIHSGEKHLRTSNKRNVSKNRKEYADKNCRRSKRKDKERKKIARKEKKSGNKKKHNRNKRIILSSTSLKELKVVNKEEPLLYNSDRLTDSGTNQNNNILPPVSSETQNQKSKKEDLECTSTEEVNNKITPLANDVSLFNGKKEDEDDPGIKDEDEAKEVDAKVEDKEPPTSQEETAKKPSVIKRKLSILEYRKRKRVSSDADYKDPRISDSVDNPPPVVKRVPDSSQPNCVDGEEGKDLQVAGAVLESSQRSPIGHFVGSPPSPLSPNYIDEPMDSPVKGDHRLTNDLSPKWSAEPTLLEQQRENLRARLKKNFGLKVLEDKRKEEELLEKQQKRIDEKLADIEKRLSLSEKMKTQATSVIPPSFPKGNKFLPLPLGVFPVPPSASETCRPPTSMPYGVVKCDDAEDCSLAQFDSILKKQCPTLDGSLDINTSLPSK